MDRLFLLLVIVVIDSRDVVGLVAVLQRKLMLSVGRYVFESLLASIL